MPRAESTPITRKRKNPFSFDWQDAGGPLAVLAGIALVDRLTALLPEFTNPSQLVLAAVLVAGFITTVRSAVLCSLIGATYAIGFIPFRNGLTFENFGPWVEACLIAVFCPLFAVSAALLRQHANRTADVLRKHLSNTPLGVIELHEDFVVHTWDGAAETIFGILSKDAVGKSLFDLPGVFFSPSEAVQVERLLEELRNGRRTKAVHAMQSDLHGSLGHSRWFWSSTLSTNRSTRFLILVEDITERVKAERELEESKSEVIERLVRAAEYRDDDTGQHVVRMALYCEALGRACGLDEDACRLLLKASPMHDIGKIGIPDDVLLKAGKLTEDEREIIKRHTLIGAQILSGSKHRLLQVAEVIALTHHEKWDGTGHPRGLKGEEIPIEGRICAVADIFDALTSERPYKKAWTMSEALAELEQIAGTTLDPELVRTFIRIRPEIVRIMAEVGQDHSLPARMAA